MNLFEEMIFHYWKLLSIVVCLIIPVYYVTVLLCLLLQFQIHTGQAVPHDERCEAAIWAVRRVGLPSDRDSRGQTGEEER